MVWGLAPHEIHSLVGCSSANAMFQQQSAGHALPGSVGNDGPGFEGTTEAGRRPQRLLPGAKSCPDYLPADLCLADLCAVEQIDVTQTGPIALLSKRGGGNRPRPTQQVEKQERTRLAPVGGQERRLGPPSAFLLYLPESPAILLSTSEEEQCR